MQNKLDIQKPITVASHPAFRGRIVDVSTERLRYANGRDTTWTTSATPVRRQWSRWTTATASAWCGSTATASWIFYGRFRPANWIRGSLRRFVRCANCGKKPASRPSAGRPWGPFFQHPAYSPKSSISPGPRPGNRVPDPDADEELELQWLPLSEACDRVLRGEWNDGKTAMALWRAQYQLQL